MSMQSNTYILYTRIIRYMKLNDKNLNEEQEVSIRNQSVLFCSVLYPRVLPVYDIYFELLREI